ncbi:hypothetical protein N9N67_03000 [Bacteriovoracaceae bacterium]|nr:hypothetical protein [Bacteriovoracaceae bacterium]
MKLLTILIFLLFSNWIFAQKEFIPDPIQKRGKKFIFVDFIQAKHQFIIKQISKKIIVKSKIIFQSDIKGYPLFDFSIRPKKITLNGKTAKIKKIRILGNYTRNASIPFTFFWGIKKRISSGTHTLEMEHELKKGVSFRPFSLRFWYWDLVGKHFLNKYLPTNMEFDQYPITMEFKSSENLLDTLDFESNAYKLIKSEGNRILEYPKHLSASSVYLHIHQKNKFPIKEFTFVNIENKSIPIRVYADKISLLKDIQTKITNELQELESVFGVWPHPNLLLYLHPSNENHNYEYAGAFESSLKSMPHEIFHGYFSRSMTPADGNSGWIDEAIAEWRDSGYPKLKSLSKNKASNLACNNKYRQRTVKESYSKGRDFISHLDYLFNQKELIFSDFLKLFLKKHKHKVINTSIFIRESSDYYGEDLKKKFCYFVCNKSTLKGCKL